MVTGHALLVPEPGWDAGLAESGAGLFLPSCFLLLPGLTQFQAELACLAQGQMQKLRCSLQLTSVLFIQSQIFIFLTAYYTPVIVTGLGLQQ